MSAPTVGQTSMSNFRTCRVVSRIVKCTGATTAEGRTESIQPHQWGLIHCVAVDPRIYGRVYLGTHGRGILYGDPVK